MDWLKKNRKIIYLSLFIVGLLFIFFVGNKVKEDGTSKIAIVANGVEHFRKGLDVSGGTRLVYRISYDKYEQIYTNISDLNEIKQEIEDIIVQNIDDRISKLGVSDYKAYSQILDNQEYIVVEIGGISNLEQAKEIIGKTTELEFRLPNEDEPSEETRAARKLIAIDLKSDIEDLDVDMIQLAENRESENIFYSSVEGVTLSQLPLIFRDKPELLEQANTGEIFPDIIDGIFAINSYQDYSGASVEEILEGFTFFKLLDRKINSIENVSLETVINAADSLGLSYTGRLSKLSNDNTQNYRYENDDFVFVSQDVSSGEAMANVKLVFVPNSDVPEFNLEPEIIGTNTSKNLDVNKVDTSDTIEYVKENIQTSDDFENADIVYDDWVNISDLKNTISNWDEDNNEDIQIYEELGNTYVVYIKDRVGDGEVLYQEVVVNGVSEDSFSKALESQTLYDLEIIFVQDKETWKTAVSDAGEILNGAYFELASASQDQVGRPTVSIQFNTKGKDIFCDISGENVGKSMGIFIGGEQITAPNINEKICGGTAQISGEYSLEEVRELVDDLNQGALPAPLILMQEEKVSPTLGTNALNGALLAGALGIIAIFVFIMLMYGVRKGLVTLGVLIVFLAILGLFMKLVNYAMSLSGIAAIILSIGMAVDANILIFERVKEERKNGKSIGSAIDIGYDRSRPAIRDGNISTGIIALLLFSFGSNIFKGFGSMLLLTTILTLLVNAPMTKELLKIMLKNK